MNNQYTKRINYFRFLVSVIVLALLAKLDVPLVFAQQSEKMIAEIGINYGNVVIGYTDTWTFTALAGDVITVAVIADKPTNEASSLDRVRLGLLDTYVRVFAPLNMLLDENDDMQPEILTNSLINKVKLPISGDYLIEVGGSQNLSGGKYQLLINTQHSAQPETDPQIEATSTPDTEIAKLTVINATLCSVSMTIGSTAFVLTPGNFTTLTMDSGTYLVAAHGRLPDGRACVQLDKDFSVSLPEDNILTLVLRDF